MQFQKQHSFELRKRTKEKRNAKAFVEIKKQRAQGECPVSYTHLDVYKRQFISFFDEVIVPGFFVLGNDFD